MINIAKRCIKFIMVLPLRLIGCLPCKDRLLFQYMLQSAKEYERHGDTFCSVYSRPKYVSQVVSVEEETELRQKTAIVMQGPLVSKDDFTVETVKIYGKLYPGVAVIVSTWKSESQEIIDRLKKLENCHVVLNDLPEHSGMLNLNYQIVSTMAGIRKAQQLGKEYVFKTRCDYRFMRIGLMEYLVNLCMRFSVDESIKYQNCRIVCGGVDGTVCFGPIG